jgi:hypothetical protein
MVPRKRRVTLDRRLRAMLARKRRVVEDRRRATVVRKGLRATVDRRRGRPASRNLALPRRRVSIEVLARRRAAIRPRRSRCGGPKMDRAAWRAGAGVPSAGFDRTRWHGPCSLMKHGVKTS